VPSRCGPRHWGQSVVETATLADGECGAAVTQKQNAAIAAINRDFIVYSFDRWNTGFAGLGSTNSHEKCFISNREFSDDVGLCVKNLSIANTRPAKIDNAIETSNHVPWYK
jgi:hypothetical protein